MDGVRIAVATAAFIPHGGLDACARSVLAQDDPGAVHIQAGFPPDSFLIVANGVGIVDASDRWAREGVTVWKPGRNLGTAAAWNRACRWAFATGHDAVLILGDDVVLTDPATLIRFAEVYAAGGLRQMRFVHPLGFSAVCITGRVWAEVGGFDEGFWPAYYEDNDYWRRFSLRGIPWEHVITEPGPVHQGSASIRADPEIAALNATTFSLNGARFVRKWGGPPLGETYAEPWNGGPSGPGVRELAGADIVARVERAYGPEEPWPWD